MANVSIITVNYNGLSDTCEMIESLRTYETCPYELIVVDNGSRVDEAAVLREKYPDVKVIRSDENLGFAGGNNLGVSQAKGDFLFFLNNDTYIDRPVLGPLTARLSENVKNGVVSPKIKFSFSGEIQFAGYTPLSRITLRNDLIGFGEEDKGQYESPRRSPFAHGAAMMVRREAIEKAGEMPEIYFLYYEELDWCERIRQAGYEIWYEPAATVYHKESRSTGRESPLKTYYMSRNRLLYARRNRQGAESFLSVCYQLFAVAPRDLLRFAAKGKTAWIKARCKGIYAGLSVTKQ